MLRFKLVESFSDYQKSFIEREFKSFVRNTVNDFGNVEVQFYDDDDTIEVTVFYDDDREEDAEGNFKTFTDTVIQAFSGYEKNYTTEPQVDKYVKCVTFFINLNKAKEEKGMPSKQELTDAIINKGKELSGEPHGYVERGFILPDGFILDNAKISGTFRGTPLNHSSTAEEILKSVYNDYADKFNHDYDFIDYLDKVFGTHMSIGPEDEIIDSFGAIRVNGSNEDYILLPKEQITNKQRYELIDWIDAFFEDNGYQRNIQVTTSDGEQQQEYDPDEYDGRKIVNKIMRFYSEGTLTEEYSDEDEKYNIIEE